LEQKAANPPFEVTMLFKLKTVSSLMLVINALFPQAVSSWESHNLEDNNGAVASESEVCSNIGIDLPKRGGNAADALVGTVLCIGVIGMYHSGQVLASTSVITFPDKPLIDCRLSAWAEGASCLSVAAMTLMSLLTSEK
jgi:hypothetical protein